MPDPCQYLPGSTYSIARRCSERRRFLRPDGFIAQVFLYLVAWAAKRFNIGIVAVVVMSNHWHAIVVDWDGKLPRFLRMVHLLSSKCVNTRRGRTEAMWGSAPPSRVRMETPNDTLEQIIYVLANPAKAGAEETAVDWPGLLVGPGIQNVESLTAERPSWFFKEKGRTPTSATLTLLDVPPGFEHLSKEEFAELVAEKLAEREAKHATEREERGIGVLGAEGVLAQDWRTAPETPEKPSDFHPHIAAKDVTVRIAAIARRRQFIADHHESRVRWCRGRRRTCFPAGTYQMRVLFGVRCHPPPT